MTDLPDPLIELEAASAQAEGEQPPPPEPAPEDPSVGTVAPDPTQELQEQLLRLRADFDNFRKRTRREKEEWSQQCLKNVCADLLTVIDSLELGLGNSERMGISADVLKGFTLVREQLVNTLAKYGLAAVEASTGAPFDPNIHEAITELASTDVAPGAVVAMTRKGYKLGSFLLRPAQVVVAAREGGA